MCIDFINGRCNRDFCLHAHSLDPEANTPEQVAQREAAYWYAQQQCRYDLLGTCTRTRCAFAHATGTSGDAPRLPSYYINRCREAANRRAERCTTHPSSLSQPPATGTPQGKSLSSGLHHLNTSCPTSPRIQLVPDSEIKQNQEDWMRCVRKPCTQMIHVAKVLMQGPVCSECLPVQEEEADTSCMDSHRRPLPAGVETAGGVSAATGAPAATGASSSSHRRSRSRSRSPHDFGTESRLQQLILPPPRQRQPQAPDYYAEVASLHERRKIEGMMHEITDLSLPIYFQHHFDEYDEDVKDSVEILVGEDCLGPRFYVGATVDPITRWLGKEVTERGGSMQGHDASWNVMHMIAYRRSGAAELEKSIIIWAKDKWPSRCSNVAMDNRGQCRNSPNWIYICL